MAMLFELVEDAVDFRQTAGFGGDDFVDLGLAHVATGAGHSGDLRAKMLGGWPLDALDFERTTGDPLGMAFFVQCAIAARLPHFPDTLDFQRTGFAIVKAADFVRRKTAFLIHGTSRHENVTVGIPVITFRVGMVKTDAKGASIGVAQLQTETTQKRPLLFGVQLMGQGDIHRAAHADIVSLLCPFCDGGKVSWRHGRTDDLGFDHIGLVL